MKYAEKFADVLAGENNGWASRMILVGRDARPCITCRIPTHFIDVCSEGHICSDECDKAFYDLIAAQEVYNEEDHDYDPIDSDENMKRAEVKENSKQMMICTTYSCNGAITAKEYAELEGCPWCGGKMMVEQSGKKRTLDYSSMTYYYE